MKEYEHMAPLYAYHNINALPFPHIGTIFTIQLILFHSNATFNGTHWRTTRIRGKYKVLAALEDSKKNWGNLKKNRQIAGYYLLRRHFCYILGFGIYAIPIFPKKPCGNKFNNAEVTPHDIHIETLLSHIGGNGWTDPSSGTHPCTNREQTWKLVIYGYFQK